MAVEIDRIADNTEWNGRKILNGTAGGASSKVAFQVGSGAKQTISLSFGNFTNGSGKTMNSLTPASTMTLSTATIASALNMGSKVITAADVAIGAVSTQRATFGAISNRLEHAIDNLTNVKTNTEAARSRILDTDYATSNF